MGQEESGDILVHVARSLGEFEVGHHIRYPALLLQQVPGEGQQGGALEGGVAHELEAIPGQVRQQANGNGVFDVDEVAEGPGQDDLLQILELEPDAFQQGEITGEHGPFGSYQVVDVRLTDGKVLAALGFGAEDQDVLPAAVPQADAGGVQVFPELAVG